MNQSGFQEECDAFALKMDRLIITKDYSALKLYLKENHYVKQMMVGIRSKTLILQ